MAPGRSAYGLAAYGLATHLLTACGPVAPSLTTYGVATCALAAARRAAQRCGYPTSPVAHRAAFRGRDARRRAPPRDPAPAAAWTADTGIRRLRRCHVLLRAVRLRPGHEPSRDRHGEVVLPQAC